MPSRHKKALGIEFTQPLNTLKRTIQRGPGRACCSTTAGSPGWPLLVWVKRPGEGHGRVIGRECSAAA
jgi:hypothetical protein